MAGPLVRNCLGVDVGAYSIRVSQVELGKAGPRITALFEERLNLDSQMSETQRFIAISKQLQDLLKREKIRTRYAVFSVPGQSVFVRTFKLPRASPERLNLMVRFEARQQIPFPLDKTIMEYQVFDDPDAAEIDVLLVAIKVEYIDHFMKFVGRTGLRPIGVSISTLALYNFHELNNAKRNLLDVFDKKKQKEAAAAAAAKAAAVGAPPGAAQAEEAKPAKKSAFSSLFKKKGAGPVEAIAEGMPEGDEAFDQVGFEEIQAYVNIGHSQMDVAIPKTGMHRMIGFPRSVPIAGNEMDRAIRDKLSLESMAEANQIKNTQTAALSTEFELDGDPDSINTAASEAVSAVADRMVSELRRSLDYYISQPDGVAVDSIVISGGLARLPYIANYLEEKMGIPVSLAALKNEQVRLPDGSSGEIYPYAISLGLAFQGLELAQNKINFLPTEAKSVLALQGRKAELAIISAMLAVVLMLNFNVGDAYTAHFKTNIASYTDKLAKTQSESDLIKQAVASQTSLKETITQVATSAGWRDYWLRFLTQMIAKRPAEVLIDSIDLQPDGSVVVSGVATKQSNVNAFIQRIKNLQYDFDGKQITIIGEAEMKNLDAINDVRFPSQVFRYKMQLQARKREGRIRVIGKAPVPAGLFDLQAQAATTAALAAQGLDRTGRPLNTD